MNTNTLDALGIARQFLGDDDLQSMLPVRPRLIPELIVVPFGREGLLVSGGNASRLLKCPGGQDEVFSAFREIDGRRTLEQLVEEVPTTIDGGMFGVLSMLVRYGFLEDAEGLGPHEPGDMLGSFFGRFLDASRINRNRQQAKARLAAETIAVLCYPSYAQEVARLLLASGAGSATVVSSPAEFDALAPSFVLAIALGSEWSSGEQAVLRRACDRGIPVLMATLGAQLVRVGPLVLPGVSCGPDCVGLQLDSIEPALTGSETHAWATYATHEAVLTLSQITPSTYLNAIQEHRRGREGYFTRRIKLARVPGSPTSGLAGRVPMSADDGAFAAWVHHTGVRIPPRRYLHPRAHQEHYSAANLAGYAKALPQVSSGQHLRLPAGVMLDAAPAWLATDAPNPIPASLGDAVATILRIAVGYQSSDDGGQRRISPSGGGLQSNAYYLYLSGLEDLPDGIFCFNGADSTLDPIPLDDPEDLLESLIGAGSTQGPCAWIISVAHLERVRNKYGDFSYNIAHLDAGVSLAFAREAAAALGWVVCEKPSFDTVSLGRLLRTHGTDNCQLVTYAFKLAPDGPQAGRRPGRSETIDDLIQAARQMQPQVPLAGKLADLPGLPATIDNTGGRSLERIMRDRRARYRFGEGAVPGQLVREMLALSHRHLGQRFATGALPLPIVPWVLRPKGDASLPAGIYEVLGSRDEDWRVRAPDFSVDEMPDCINQVSLARAGIIVTYVADLEAILQRYGPAGYRQALVSCGAAVAHLWLIAQGAGLVGTAAGGIIEQGLMQRTGLDGYTESPVFSLVLGVSPDALPGAVVENGALTDAAI